MQGKCRIRKCEKDNVFVPGPEGPRRLEFYWYDQAVVWVATNVKVNPALSSVSKALIAAWKEARSS